MGKIFIFALAAAVYPTLLAIVILILARPHPVRLFTGFLIGGMTMSITVGLAILGLADTSNLGTTSSNSPRPVINLVLGVLFLCLGFVLASGRDVPGAGRRATRKATKAAKAEEAAKAAEEGGEEPKESWATRLLTRDSMALAIVLGVVLNLPSVWYLAALKEIDDGGYSAVANILLVVGFNLIMFALIEIPLAFYLLMPDRAAAAVARFDAWTRSHLRQIGVVLALIAGTYLVIDGIIDLI
jgi:hypothetical protein